MTKDFSDICMVVDDRLGSGLSVEFPLAATVFGNVFEKYTRSL